MVPVPLFLPPSATLDGRPILRREGAFVEHGAAFRPRSTVCVQPLPFSSSVDPTARARHLCKAKV